MFATYTLAAGSFAFAAIFGNVRGVVRDPSDRLVRGAQVELRSVSSDWERHAETDGNGAFLVPAVPLGRYRLRIRQSGFTPVEATLEVASASAPVREFQLSVETQRQSAEVVERSSGVEPDSATATTLVSRADVRSTPGAERTNSLAMITAYVPGAFLIHNQIHVRGGHQVTWAVDGIPVANTNIASNVGPQFDPKDIDYVEAQRGGYSAEWGDRTYGVFNVVPRTGFERDREGEIVAGFGNFFQTDDQVSLGAHTERFAWYGSLNGSRTDLGLAPPAPYIVHDRANGIGGFGTLVYHPSSRDQLRLVTSLRRDFYQIPIAPDEEAVQVRDVEHESDAFVNFSWVSSLKPNILLTVSPFYHFNRGDYEGGIQDVPLRPLQDRSSHYAGVQVSLAGLTAKHNARAGIYAFGQRDHNSFGIDANDGAGVSLRQRLALGGNLEAVFLEDQWTLYRWITLTGGLRLTHFGGSISENAASPRLGGALRIPKLNWTFRAFYGRYYQAPPLSTVSGPLLAYAVDQGFGFLPLHGERDEERQFGVAVPFRGWTVDGDYFRTRARHFFDHSVLGNSNIFFPVNVDAARISGWELTLRSPQIFQRGQAHLAYANLRAEGQGLITGGLTDSSPPAGRFLLDHDQRQTLSGGFQVSCPYHSWVSGSVYYGSGFADNGGPRHLPHHVSVDLMAGRQFGETWTVSVSATNVANRRLLLDNSETFGGSHYAYPREIFAQVRYRFHF